MADVPDTVGSLLAAIATALLDALRILMFADKRGWGPGEFEQLRALEEALAEARRDFQAMAPLVNGQLYYENDRRTESLDELRTLRAQFALHAQTLKDWLRAGGPINPLWARETTDLRRQLHRAQCRAARRIFNAEREDGGSGARCLGAFLIYRRLRADADCQREREHQREREREREHGRGRTTLARVPTWKRQQQRMQKRDEERYVGRERLSWGTPADGDETDGGAIELGGMPPVSKTAPAAATIQEVASSSHSASPAASSSPYATPPSLTLEDLVPDCNGVGSFERFGDQDIVFICDYCDGHIVWEDVHRLPTTRLPATTATTTSLPSPTSPPSREPRLPMHEVRPASATSAPLPATTADGYPRWQATTAALTDRDKERTIVFAPLAIANHLPPAGGDWEARLWCPYCDEYTYYDSAEGDHTKYAQSEFGFPSLAAFQEHLEWYHTALPVPALPTAVDNCAVM